MRLKIAIAAFTLATLAFQPSYAEEQAGKEAPAATAAVKPKAPAEKPQPLSEKEESELAKRAEEPGREVAGGALSNLHLTYIVIALAAAVLVLVLK